MKREPGTDEQWDESYRIALAEWDNTYPRFAMPREAFAKWNADLVVGKRKAKSADD